MNRELIVNELDRLFENPKCELEYNKDYELLLAVMLSAQTTDKRVNIVTRELFKDCDSLDKLDKLSESDISELRLGIIKETLSHHGLSLDDNDYYVCDETPDDFDRALDHLTQKGTNIPDAIICYNDRLAYELIITAENKGYKINLSNYLF